MTSRKVRVYQQGELDSLAELQEVKLPLEAWIAQKKMTRAKFAKDVGVSPVTVSRWINVIERCLPEDYYERQEQGTLQLCACLLDVILSRGERSQSCFEGLKWFSSIIFYPSTKQKPQSVSQQEIRSKYPPPYSYQRKSHTKVSAYVRHYFSDF